MKTHCSAQITPKIIVIRVISFIPKGMLVKLPLFWYKKNVNSNLRSDLLDLYYDPLQILKNQYL